MQDSIYHMTLKSHFVNEFCTKTARFRLRKHAVGHQRITLRSTPLVDYRFLSYDVASESVIKPCIKNDNELVD